MLRYIRIILLCSMLAGCFCTGASALSDYCWTDSTGWYWQIVDYSPQANPGDITFWYNPTLSQLSVNRPSVTKVGNGSSSGTSTLTFSGLWAVCGVVENGVFTADPYATFSSIDSTHWTITWASNTPTDYAANLLLGYQFDGDGHTTYSQTNPYPSVDATLALKEFGASGTRYYYLQNSVQVAPPTPQVPEPSAIVFAAYGLIGVLLKRK